MLSVSRERDFDVQNVLSRELCSVPLDLFYPNGARRRTAKSNLLNEIATSFNEESLSGWNCYGFHGNNRVYWLQQVERFSNVADEISAKFLSRFLECEVMVVVPDQYDFTFSISWKKTPNRRLIHSKLKLLVTEKFQRHVKVTLEIRTVKPTWWNTFSKK